MEPGGSVPNSQGISWAESTKFFVVVPISLRSVLVLSSYPKDLFPVRLPVKILRELLTSFILAVWHSHLNLLDSIILTITNYEVPHLVAFSTSHLHHSWAQIFASESCSIIFFKNFKIWQKTRLVILHNSKNS